VRSHATTYLKVNKRDFSTCWTQIEDHEGYTWLTACYFVLTHHGISKPHMYTKVTSTTFAINLSQSSPTYASSRCKDVVNPEPLASKSLQNHPCDYYKTWRPTSTDRTAPLLLEPPTAMISHNHRSQKLSMHVYSLTHTFPPHRPPFSPFVVG
jgi:hypothetical protein